MGEIKQIRLCGLGGQGIVLGGTILGHAGINDGKWVAGSSSYGAEARGSACRSEVIISDEPIIFPHVTRPDILIAMSQEAYDKYIKDMGRDEETVIYDEQMVCTKEISGLRQLGFPAGNVATKELENKLVANVVILGIVAEVTRIVSQDALLSAIEKNVPERFKALNLRAAELGLALGRAKK
ncbi:2-oxoacid:acceptor oxidoreductase family protein [Dehalococcoidia bacterium]|nr:2-oxoacid:acceptor oxidoreductase family protein [Dehalococcoidia bacterium]MCL0089332.1 2-oxoacid:acceptor oxidoreductase family protein [Dehalococcoidia bacterium]